MRTQCCGALASGQCSDCPLTVPMRPDPLSGMSITLTEQPLDLRAMSLQQLQALRARIDMELQLRTCGDPSKGIIVGASTGQVHGS